MKRVILDNKIIVENPGADMIQWCRENLVMDNPDFYKKERMGKWTGNTPKQIYLYEQDGDVLYLPFGLWNINFYNRVKTNYAIFSALKDITPISFDSHTKLYGYQEKAVQAALTAKNGIIVMPCGAGKTQTALELISRIGGKALWLTHTQDLLNQSMTRAKSLYDIDKNAYGTITEGKVNIGSHITFATVQTMSKINLEQFKNAFDVVVVDECQRCAGSPTRVTQFYKVLSNLSCRYKYGLTATPKRADGLEKSMFVLLGGIIHEVSRDAVADTTCPVKVKMIRLEYMPDFDIVLSGDGTINYSQLVDDLTHDGSRFDDVFSELTACNGPTLVLANRVEYLQKMCQKYIDGNYGKAICLSNMGTSKKAKAERKEALQKLNTGELDCIFATYQLAKEGLDVPNLRYVIFATPEKDETTITQAAGRVGRKADGKAYGTVIDFEDNFGMFHGWAKKRRGFYKKLGYEVVE